MLTHTPQMADNSSMDLMNLFAGLTPSSGRASLVNNSHEGNSAQSGVNRQPSPFDFTSHGPELISPGLPPSKGTTPVPSNDQSGVDRTASLLNRLKFNHPSASSPTTSSQPESPALSRPGIGGLQGGQSSSTSNLPGRGISASDLVASLSPKPTSSSRPSTSVLPQITQSFGSPGATSNTNPQDFLLQLLNRSKSSQITAFRPSNGNNNSQKPNSTGLSLPTLEAQQNDQSSLDSSTQKKLSTESSPRERGASVRNDSPIRIFGSNGSKETTPFEPKDMPKIEPVNEPLFTYVNPFEQLAASSPRNAKSRSGNVTPRDAPSSSNLAEYVFNGDGNKRKSSKESSPSSVHTSSRRKLTTGGSEILQSIEHPNKLFSDSLSQVEALLEIGAPTNDTETVAEALNEVGGRVSRQVEDALNQAEATQDESNIKEEELREEREVPLHVVAEELQEAAAEVKQELDKEENSDLLQSIMSESLATAVKDTINEAATGDLVTEEENGMGKESPVDETDHSIVRVYNFPLKPFVSIDLKQDTPATLALRQDAIMDIARLKKEFDQTDRTLATGTDDYIIYGMSKPGGLRIIRQDDGLDRHIFKDTRDRIFNVTVSTAPPGSLSRGTQTLVATGISGTVYWAIVCQASGDSLKEEILEELGLAFPPVPAHDENTSGGQLKTRAKRSSRHPEFFAIGRGKSIQIVFPFHAKSSKHLSSTFMVDAERYYKDRNLKISTGKAGKDFTFSEDDSMIITLDKAGRVRFWDIRDLVHEENATASKIAPIEVKTPMLTFSTAFLSEKSWPTSVLFVDKLRPYIKGIALRYIIVGMKQNHTLQLWDLGLGKAVQELSFPHKNESDAICSVCYHPASGIVVVGHPTRNSIYFIHLSAPKYNLPSMSQAKYVQRLASKDPTLPKPESTAIMSGMREYSFSSKGQLRSIDLLPKSAESTRGFDNTGDSVLFELYIMHSKGVTCLNIKKQDLGWSSDNKILHPVDAEKVGCIIVRDLREPQLGPFSERSSVNGDTIQPTPTSTIAEIKPNNKDTPKTIIPKTASTAAETSVAADGMTGSAMEKVEKKKKRRVGPGMGDSAIPPPAPSVSDSYAAAAQRARSPSNAQTPTRSAESTRPILPKSGSIDAPELAPSPDTKAKRSLGDVQPTSVGISNDFLEKELKKIEKSVTSAFTKVMDRELSNLYRRLDDDKRVQDAAGAAKQDAILRLISSSLTDNIDKALSRHINDSIQQEVLPSITKVASSTLSKSVSETVSKQLHNVMPTQLKSALPEAIGKALQNQEVLRVISDKVTSKIAGHVEKEFSAILLSTISPEFQKLAVSTVQNTNIETERRLNEQLQRAESQRYNDNIKIDQLTALVRGLSETVHTMAAAQSEFQSEILKLQQQSLRERQEGSARSSSDNHQPALTSSSSSSEPELSPEQEELERIASLMKEGQFENGTMAVSLAALSTNFKSL